MMFWIWMPTVPYRQKLGILTGICCHMVMKILSKNEMDRIDGEDGSEGAIRNGD